jgi:hypothetical protein
MTSNSKEPKQSLSVTHPELAAQAVGWDPTQFLPGSNKKKLWRCELNHEWVSVIANRTKANGSNCPFCKGKAVWPGFNDLQTTNPELAKQAFGWDPTTLTAGSGKKVGWICSSGHKWEAVLHSRTKGLGCPICSGQRVLSGFNDLATTHPELLRDVVGWDPTVVSAGSELKKLWKCDEGHEWVTAVANRTRGTGCPYCSGNQVLQGFNDLATTHPDIAAEADGWDPTTVSAGMGKAIQWRCKVGHLWKSSPNNRTGKLYGCPICSGHQLQSGFNDLATTHPDIAAEADGWDPSKVGKSFASKVKWKCPKGHSYSASVGSRTSAKSGCPICSGYQTLPGVNDLATTHPEIAAQGVGWDPTQVSFGSGQKLRWKCQNLHEWEAVVASRTSGLGCPICSGQELLKGFNDLATTHPDLAALAHGWDPSTVTFGSGQRKNWQCSLGHIYKSPVFRLSSGGGCAICAGKTVLAGFNDLETKFPEIAKMADGWDPKTKPSSSHQKLSWKCDKGHKWKAVLSNLTSRKAGCPICSGRHILIGFNDLATVNPGLAAEAVGWDPKTITSRSGRKRRWKCDEGHEWVTAVANRTKGTGCPSCAIYGYDPNKEGWLYFLRHKKWQLLQIGITNVPDGRIAIHRKLGWELLEIRGPMDGVLTQIWEREILQMLKKKGAKLSPIEIAGKFTGFTESWVEESYPTSSLKALMETVRNEEDQN